MQPFEIEHQINEVLAEKLFAGFKSYLIAGQRERLLNSAEYKSLQGQDAVNLLNKSYKDWYENSANFYLSLKSLFAVVPLALREIQILNFETEQVFRVKAEYSYKGVDFSATYPSHFNADMQREIEDCVAYLSDPKHSHIVDKYISITDTEKQPHPPLTMAQLKYSCFYLYGMQPETVTELSNLLFEYGLITNPQTSGWNIEDSVSEDIITLLNQTYSPEQVLQSKRVFTKNGETRDHQECIRPVEVSSRFFPKRLSESEAFERLTSEHPEASQKDLLNLYGFIFYITISTQMRNSIYDTSKIEIAVGNKRLHQEANFCLPGQENWELLSGKMIKKVQSSENFQNIQTVILPEVPPETKLLPLAVYSYAYKKKRPPRYGVGRFVTQILESNQIGENAEHDLIISELLETKSVSLIKQMLVPQDSIVLLTEWAIEYFPFILNVENYHEIQEKIVDVSEGRFPLQNLLSEMETMIESAFEASGIELDDVPPSDAKIKMLKLVAQKHGLTLDPDVFQSTAKADRILGQYPLSPQIPVGKCPNCNATVLHKEFEKEGQQTSHYYSCENFKNGCDFSIWDNYIYQFFSQKGIELYTPEEREETIKNILAKKKGYLFTGFVAKNQKPYDATVYCEKYQDKKTNKEKWGLSLRFSRKKT